MAIPRRGSRKITVDGVQYRWKMNDNFTASVELYETPVATLSIRFSWATFHVVPHGYCEVFDEVVPDYPITPRIIENCIHGALNRGWQPHKGGPIFRYEQVTPDSPGREDSV